MHRIQQRTIQRRVEMAGIGLHSGSPARMALLPAPRDTGIVFVRTDVRPVVEIEAKTENVVDTALATRIGTLDEEGRLIRIGTIEHLMACLYGLGIDNVRVEIAGPELPAMDGSAAPFVRAVQSAGVREQGAGRRVLVIKKKVEVRDGSRLARIVPARRPRVSCSVDYDHPLVGSQRIDADLSEDLFVKSLCSARTFGFLRDVRRMKAAGHALGGSLENAVVIGDSSILNAGGLRFKDEFVRHKALDAMGDLALLGMPVLGHVTAVCSGHEMHNRLCREVLAHTEAFEIIETVADEEEQYVPHDAFPALVNAAA